MITELESLPTNERYRAFGFSSQYPTKEAVCKEAEKYGDVYWVNNWRMSVMKDYLRLHGKAR